MKQTTHLLRQINDMKDTICHVQFPLYVLSGSTNSKRNMVIFLGEDFRNLPDTDLDRAMKVSNQCLDYIRRECAGYELYYKPHPTETDEYTLLDLKGFTMMERAPVELAFMKHADRIHHVFSTCSTGARTAYDFGFNSSLFLDPIAPALDPRTVQGFRELFSTLPEECFIQDFSQPLRENKKKQNSDRALDAQIRMLTAGRRGTAWILIGDPNALPYAKCLDMLVRKHNPDMKMHLVISLHHRWKVMPMDEVKKLFDAVSFIPRPFYSVRPKKLLDAWRTARLIRAWPMGNDDIIISRLGLAFTDNCFVSYFPHIPRIALMTKDFFDLACGEQMLDPDRYERRAGATLFHYILEPLLGIEQTEYFEDMRRIGNVYRYTRPLNDIFNAVWVH